MTVVEVEKAKAFRNRLTQSLRQMQPEEICAKTPQESSIAIAGLVRSSRSSLYIQAESLSRKIWESTEISYELSRAFSRGVFVELYTTERAAREDSFAFWTIRKHCAVITMRKARKFRNRFVAADRRHSFVFGTAEAKKGGTLFLNDRFKAISNIVSSQRTYPIDMAT